MLLQIATTLVVFFLTLAVITVVVQQRHYMRAGFTFLIGLLLFCIPVFFALDLMFSVILYAAGGFLIAFAIVNSVKRLRLRSLRALRDEIVAERREQPGALTKALVGVARTGGRLARASGELVVDAVAAGADRLAGDRPLAGRRPVPALEDWTPPRRSAADDRSWSAAARSLFRHADREEINGGVPGLLHERHRAKAVAAASVTARKPGAGTSRPAEKAFRASEHAMAGPARESAYLARLARRR